MTAPMTPGEAAVRAATDTIRQVNEAPEVWTYKPDYAVHPGEIIEELLTELGMKQAHLAGACKVSPKHMNQVVCGVKPLHAQLAVAIEFATGRPIAEVLMRMQASYDVHMERARRAADAEAFRAYFMDYSPQNSPVVAP